MPDGFKSIAEALAAATAELGEAEPSAIPDASPAKVEEAAASQEQAAAVDNEHPDEAGDDEIAALLDHLADEGDGETGAELSPLEIDSPEFWSQTIVVETSDGPAQVTFDDLRKGYMRQADYTRKTQELASQRRVTEEAVEFYSAFRENPQEFARYLAAKAKLIDGEAPQVEGVPLFTQDQLAAEVQRRVQEEVARHPDVLAAQEDKQVEAVLAQFAGIEDDYSVRLSDDHKQTILREAVRQNTTNLRLVFEALLSRAQRTDAARQSVKAAATKRPSARSDRGDEEPEGPARTVAEAFARAKASAEL